MKTLEYLPGLLIIIALSLITMLVVMLIPFIAWIGIIVAGVVLAIVPAVCWVFLIGYFLTRNGKL